MPLVKTYKRYSPLASFGVIGSPRSNAVLLGASSVGNHTVLAACAALQDVLIWDVKRCEKVCTLKGDKEEATVLCVSPDGNILAVGYNDGVVKLWDMKSRTSNVTLSGHKSAITSLAFDQNGTRLSSGSRDTDVIIWDVLTECGIYRLKGHKGPVTCCGFMRDREILVTSSKDTFVKFWDLDTQHCFLTLVGHRSEVWQFCLVNQDTRLVTGSSDSELRVWKISSNDEQVNDGSDTLKRPFDEVEKSMEQVENGEVKAAAVSCVLLGSIMRQSRERIVSMTTDGRFLLCHGSDSMVELFKLLTEQEISDSMKKRRKKLRKKEKLKSLEEQNLDVGVERSVDDEICKVQQFPVKHKIRSCDFSADETGALKVLLLHSNNSFGYYKLSMDEATSAKCVPISMNSKAGHRSDVRTLAFNSDATCILSGSGDSLKIWNRSSQACIRTLDSDYCLSAFFVPGDRHVVVGAKSGAIQLFDISASVLLESVEAHEGAVWGLSLAPDKKGFVSGSADHSVKFWEFELIDDENYSTTSKRLSMSHVRTLKMSEEVLGVLYSPDQRLLAVSLLDCTVKVFFADTLKFFLSLYGHKFPVLCMDISLDNSLLVTGSADKNVKLWGLDFGDCHKSIFAHDDSITSVKFVGKTHYFFTASKDKSLKYWDADKFQNIMTLQGHQAEIWSMSVSAGGEYVVSGSHDRSIRLWQRTEELLVIDEEREQEREVTYEQSVADSGEPVIPGEAKDNEATFAGKKTVETVKSAERIMEAILLYNEETERWKEYEEACASGGAATKPERHPILKAHGDTKPLKYVLDVLKKVRSSELEESLLVLPFDYVIDLLQLIDQWMTNNWEVELCSRCLFFLLKIHHGQITSNQVLLSCIESLREHSQASAKQLKDQVGFNLAGLRYLQDQLEQSDVSFFGDASEKIKQNKKKKRKTLIEFK